MKKTFLLVNFINWNTTALILLGIFLTLPSSYYLFQRYVVELNLFVVLYLLYKEMEIHNMKSNATIRILIVAVLAFILMFNPVIPIYFYNKLVWISIDIILLIVIWYVLYRNREFINHYGINLHEALDLLAALSILIVGLQIGYCHSNYLPFWFNYIVAIITTITLVSFTIMNKDKYRLLAQTNINAFTELHAPHDTPPAVMIFLICLGFASQYRIYELGIFSSFNFYVFVFVYVLYFQQKFRSVYPVDQNFRIFYNKSNIYRDLRFLYGIGRNNKYYKKLCSQVSDEIRSILSSNKIDFVGVKFFEDILSLVNSKKSNYDEIVKIISYRPDFYDEENLQKFVTNWRDNYYASLDTYI